MSLSNFAVHENGCSFRLAKVASLGFWTISVQKELCASPFRRVAATWKTPRNCYKTLTLWILSPMSFSRPLRSWFRVFVWSLRVTWAALWPTYMPTVCFGRFIRSTFKSSNFTVLPRNRLVPHHHVAYFQMTGRVWSSLFIFLFAAWRSQVCLTCREATASRQHLRRIPMLTIDDSWPWTISEILWFLVANLVAKFLLGSACSRLHQRFSIRTRCCRISGLKLLRLRRCGCAISLAPSNKW